MIAVKGCAHWNSDSCEQFVDVEKLADTRASAEAEGESE